MSLLIPSPWTPDVEEWRELLAGEPAYRARQVWQGLYDRGLAPSELSSLPAALRRRLDEAVRPSLRLEREQRDPVDGTVKWLWRTDDVVALETVLMPYRDRVTVCVSSQAGCAMACGFCATGQAGYQRNLSVGEILEQVVAARAAAAPRRLSNIVFMGMGEPFANYDRVLIAVRRIVGDLRIGARHVTVSTIGLVPAIDRFAGEGLQVGLAVSLHAANDELRSDLVPVNRRHPIADVVAAARRFRERTGRRVSFEWAMIDGVNDRPSDADELAVVATDARAHVNLIPLNPTPGWPTTGSPAGRISDFARRLTDRGINVTVRANRGTGIDAACGQLAAGHHPEPGTPVTMGRRRRPRTGAQVGGLHAPPATGPSIL
ncbi:MAG: 23S rRNA (adenine(2503)-C(2))-methyltransferase RlmN [Acidimicrobiia bacterium]|nr:23S rRNA (adenine(2503)-C(2))-methyltransferase RlmN [Acidimicrobiia bacterium]